MRYKITLPLFLSIAISLLACSPAQANTTKEVFKQYENRLLQVRIIDINTNSKSTIGSGFFIDDKGTIATNYHVISRHIFKPKQYRIEFVTDKNQVHGAQLLDIDVVHDLALLTSDLTETPYLELASDDILKGERIYTLGDPLDLGMTIVEGTYNGLTGDTIYEHILLSSALNPGMSGGPSILKEGTVIGVNVATAGNSIGFLVPIKYLVALIKRQAVTVDKDFMQIMREQLIAHQEKYIHSILGTKFKTKLLGHYEVPDKLTEYLNCWGDSDDKKTYTVSRNTCSFKNDINLDRNFTTGYILYKHYHLQSQRLNAFRFYSLMQNRFTNFNTELSYDKENYTPFNCSTDYVQSEGIKFKATLCLRGYQNFSDLYDLVLNAATLTDNKTGLVTTLVIAGVSHSNAIAFAKAYLGAFKWKRR